MVKTSDTSHPFRSVLTAPTKFTNITNTAPSLPPSKQSSSKKTTSARYSPSVHIVGTSFQSPRANRRRLGSFHSLSSSQSPPSSAAQSKDKFQALSVEQTGSQRHNGDSSLDSFASFPLNSSLERVLDSIDSAAGFGGPDTSEKNNDSIDSFLSAPVTRGVALDGHLREQSAPADAAIRVVDLPSLGAQPVDYPSPGAQPVDYDYSFQEAQRRVSSPVFECMMPGNFEPFAQNGEIVQNVVEPSSDGVDLVAMDWL